MGVRWVDSGSGGGFEINDDRPGFDPMALVVATQDLLASSGLQLNLTPNQLYVALIASADLLRALGVRPENP